MELTKKIKLNMSWKIGCPSGIGLIESVVQGYLSNYIYHVEVFLRYPTPCSCKESRTVMLATLRASKLPWVRVLGLGFRSWGLYSMIVGRRYSVIENHMGKKEMGVYKDLMKFSLGVLFKGTKGLSFVGCW